MTILGIETSCDETAAAIIEGSTRDKPVAVLSNVMASSLALHAQTGGIIPEVAARKQSEYIIPILQKTFIDAKKKPRDIEAIAVTVGPGLIGSLLIGVETARSLAFAWSKPLIPINHLFGHIYANFIQNPSLEKKIQFPALALVVSGGHTDLLLLKNHRKFTFLGETRDDAAGECFDKCARLLGYAYPGGPKIAELSKKGNASAFDFPRPMRDSNNYDFSFSGLKTAFLHKTREYFPIIRTDPSLNRGGWQQVVLEQILSEAEKQTLSDLCASLQQAIIDILLAKTFHAAKEFGVRSLLLGGGVAANNELRSQLRLSMQAAFEATELFVPQKPLCTDNAAMIAAAAFYAGKQTPWQQVTANPDLFFA